MLSNSYSGYIEEDVFGLSGLIRYWFFLYVGFFYGCGEENLEWFVV